jgi:hypothetical protein
LLLTKARDVIPVAEIRLDMLITKAFDVIPVAEIRLGMADSM